MFKLLHVDDDADILEVAKMSLELSGGFETVGSYPEKKRSQLPRTTCQMSCYWMS